MVGRMVRTCWDCGRSIMPSRRTLVKFPYLPTPPQSPASVEVTRGQVLCSSFLYPFPVLFFGGGGRGGVYLISFELFPAISILSSDSTTSNARRKLHDIAENSRGCLVEVFSLGVSIRLVFPPLVLGSAILRSFLVARWEKIFSPRATACWWVRYENTGLRRKGLVGSSCWGRFSVGLLGRFPERFLCFWGGNGPLGILRDIYHNSQVECKRCGGKVHGDEM